MRPKTDYRRFPPQYFDAVNAFAVGGGATYRMGPFDTKAAARKTQLDMYRFFSYVRDASTTGDPVATDLAEHINLMMLSVEHRNGWCYVALHTHPVVTAMGPMDKREVLLKIARGLPRPTYAGTPQQNPLTPPAADAISTPVENDNLKKEPNK